MLHSTRELYSIEKGFFFLFMLNANNHKTTCFVSYIIIPQSLWNKKFMFCWWSYTVQHFCVICITVVGRYSFSYGYLKTGRSERHTTVLNSIFSDDFESKNYYFLKSQINNRQKKRVFFSGLNETLFWLVADGKLWMNVLTPFDSDKGRPFDNKPLRSCLHNLFSIPLNEFKFMANFMCH